MIIYINQLDNRLIVNDKNNNKLYIDFAMRSTSVVLGLFEEPPFRKKKTTAKQTNKQTFEENFPETRTKDA